MNNSTKDKKMNQTIDQIVENENIARIAWEKETVVTEAGHTIADLREAFEVVEDPDHWKNPIVASLLPHRAEITVEAIRYFHGVNPTVKESVSGDRVMIKSPGYAC